jgi:hypothetical protein
MRDKELAIFMHDKAGEYINKHSEDFPDFENRDTFYDIHPISRKRYIWVAKQIKKALGVK